MASRPGTSRNDIKFWPKLAQSLYQLGEWSLFGLQGHSAFHTEWKETFPKKERKKQTKPTMCFVTPVSQISSFFFDEERNASHPHNRHYILRISLRAISGLSQKSWMVSKVILWTGIINATGGETTHHSHPNRRFPDVLQGSQHCCKKRCSVLQYSEVY